MTTFDDFDLDERVHAAVSALGFEKPTSIQTSAIPVLREGKDVIGRARTGSGKTAAFGLPLIEKVKDGSKDVRALVLAPTRELAIQVGEALRTFATQVPVNILTIYGGSPYGPQLKGLKKGVPIVVGTPGRVIDHMERGTLDLSNVEMLVLDEADEMLRMGFIEAVEQVLSSLPDDRQIALFSATMPRQVERIAKRFLVDPVVLPVEDDGVEHIEQCYLRVPQRKKLAALERILLGTARGTTLVFARTRVGCAEVADALSKNGVAADAIHGDLNQAARERVIARLKARTVRVLVATDVAARGIDIRHITHVINLDLPGDTETYVHRIGRTARAGAEGAAISFVTPNERRRLAKIQKDLKIRMKEIFPPSNEELAETRRSDIWTDLRGHLDLGVPMRAWLRALQEEQGVDAEEVALAALSYLSEQRSIPLQEIPRPKNKKANPSSMPRERSNPKNALGKERDLLNEVRVFLSIGKRLGVEVKDIVGAIANEAGVPGSRIGQVQLFDRKCIVGLPKDVADHLIQNHPILGIRGHSTHIALARAENKTTQSKYPKGKKWGGPRVKRRKKPQFGGRRGKK